MNEREEELTGMRVTMEQIQSADAQLKKQLQLLRGRLGRGEGETVALREEVGRRDDAISSLSLKLHSESDRARSSQERERSLEQELREAREEATTLREALEQSYR
jgi:chromosome segregation ATPase